MWERLKRKKEKLVEKEKWIEAENFLWNFCCCAELFSLDSCPINCDY